MVLMNKGKDSIIRICIVSYQGYSLYDPTSNIPFGGTEIQLYLLSKEFGNDKKYDVHVITSNFKKNVPEKKYNNIHIHASLPFKRKRSIRVPIKLFLLLYEINPDIVIQRAFGVPTGICALYALLFKKKFIYSIAHEIDVNGEAEKGLLGKIYKFGFSHANFIVAQHENQIKILERIQKRKCDKIFTIKSGYDITQVKVNTKKYILWVGRAVRWKRPEFFLRLAKYFPKEQFLMIINKSIDLNYWAKIESEAKKIGNLQLIEKVPFKDIGDYFKQGKIFINTSSYEGFPNTFIQALKNETPIISLNVDPDDFLVNNTCGFNCLNNFDEMISKLKKLLNNPEVYRIYSKNSFNYVKKNHDIKKISIKWKKVINYLTKS